MRWRNKYENYTRPARPKARRLAKDEQEKLLKTFSAHVHRSPVLAALDCQVTAARGRFYIDRGRPDSGERWGRITPLAGSSQCLLERERRQSQWYTIVQGGPKKVMDTIAGDTTGTFHGLGSIDAALRKAGGDPQQLEIQAGPPSPDDETNCPTFFYRASGRRCTAQEALHFHFGIPLNVLIEPRDWYVRHRKPLIVEYSPNGSRVLVQFISYNISGSIIGTCLYLRHASGLPNNADDAAEATAWAAYTIRPNASDSIAMAEAWIAKRKWEPW